MAHNSLTAAYASLFVHGTLCRHGDVIQCYRDGDLEWLTRRRDLDGEVMDPWVAWCFPPERTKTGDPVFDAPFEGIIPADFAQRAALEGRIVYAADPWSTWTEDR